MAGDTETDRFIQSLMQLGFSQYMARCYASLLTTEPQTGYAVAKATGVPQPKVYETLRKLVARGAAHQLAGEPARYVAVPRDELFADLKSSFDERLHDARESSRNLVRPDAASLEPVHSLHGHAAVIDAAVALLGSVSDRVSLSASPQEIAALEQATVACAERGAAVEVLAFDPPPKLERPGIAVFRRASTAGAPDQALQARHVALVGDERETVYAIAADGATWQGIQTKSAPIIAVVTGHIRHDIDLQQVYARLGEELDEAYGPDPAN